MHRLKRWINEAVSSYEEQLKENPIETIAISLSWVFVIIIGLMAVLAYIKFIIDGGYSLSVARIKENGAFASANFTTGTIHIISNNVVWIRNNYWCTDHSFNYFIVCRKRNMEMHTVCYRFNCNCILLCKNGNGSK